MRSLLLALSLASLTCDAAQAGCRLFGGRRAQPTCSGTGVVAGCAPAVATAGVPGPSPGVRPAVCVQPTGTVRVYTPVPNSCPGGVCPAPAVGR